MSSTLIPDWVPADAWAGYVAMRKLIKKPLTDGAIKRNLNELARLVAAGEDATAVLNQSEDKNYLGVFPIPRAQQPQHVGAPRLALVDQQAQNNAEAKRRLLANNNDIEGEFYERR